MAHDVFISYSTQNTEFADAVCEHLENEGIECWIAPRNIKTGTNYAKEIMDGLDTAKIVVLVFSQDAQESKYVNNEIDTAFSKGKHIVALKVDDTFPKDEMEFFLKNTQWLDASPSALKQENKTLESCYNQLVDDVKRVLKTGRIISPGIPEVRIEKKEKSFLDKYKLPLIALIILVIAVIGFMAYSSMTTETADEKNETALSIGYIGFEDNGGGSYSYYVFGTIAEGLNNSSKDTVHVDFYDKNGNVIDTSDTKLGEVDGNILGSIDVSKKNVDKVSVELKDTNNKVLYKEESNNIIEQ